MHSLGDSFCGDFPKLRQLLLPGTLVTIDSAACRGAQLILLVISAVCGMELKHVCSASIMSGLEGLGSERARPMWPVY